jgi:hypothetical protein
LEIRIERRADYLIIGGLLTNMIQRIKQFWRGQFVQVVERINSLGGRPLAGRDPEGELELGTGGIGAAENEAGHGDDLLKGDCVRQACEVVPAVERPAQRQAVG